MKHKLFLIPLAFVMISCSPTIETEPTLPPEEKPAPQYVKIDKVVEQCQAQPELPWCEPQ